MEHDLKRRTWLRWTGVAVLLLCALLPRLPLSGKIPAIQPQWALRASSFWQALAEGELHETYIAPHPGLTVMWYAGAAQQLSSDSTRYGLVLAASRANAVVATLLILLSAWLVRRILALDKVEQADSIALFFGFFLAFNPFLILMTGLIGLDGPVSLMMLVAFLALVLHLRRGSAKTLMAAGLTTGLAVATKVPALLLLPAPLVLWLGGLPVQRVPWRRVMLTLGVLVVAAAVITWALLPAAWIDPLGIAEDLLVGKSPRDESFREVMTRGHQQFFFGSTSKEPGVLFHPVQLLYRTTPLVLLGALFGLLSPVFRKSRLVREAALFLLIVLLGLTVTGKKTWRYICPAVIMLDLIGAVGLWLFVKDLAERWRKPALIAVAWVALAIQGLWVLQVAPYYGLRLNPLLGGPTTAKKVIPIGAGEGLERALQFLASEAERLGRPLSWSGGYGSHPRKRKALEFQSEWLEWIGKSPKKEIADCHLYYITDLQRGELKEKKADELWRSQGVRVLTVAALGVDLVEVKCREDLGIRPVDGGKEVATNATRRRGRLPEIIAFISLDTTRADRLSAYGYDLPTTPFLERLADQGVLIETAVSPMPTTDPSHLTMFTGLYPRTHGTLRNGVPLRDPSLPNLVERMRELGYRTGAFVSRKHLIPASLKLFGFDVENGPDGPERDGAETVDYALQWTREQQSRPVFVWLHLFDPHFPYDPPEPYRSRFESPASEWPIPQHHRFPDPFPKEFMEVLAGRYDAEIAYTDSLVERFVGEVKELVPEGETPLVIVVGDHGEALDEVWDRYDVAFDHGQLLNQGQLHVPLLFWWPGRLEPGVVESSAVALVDVAPTLFDILRAPGFPSQGKSLLPRIGDSSAEGFAFSQRRARMRRDGPRAKKWRQAGVEHYAVQDGRYKLILYVSKNGERSELYDLESDPLEENDLAITETDIHDRLLGVMKIWLERTPTTTAKQEIPEEKLEALKALGYLD